MAMMSIADHDVVDVEDDDSKGGDVDDLDGDCSAWRLSVPYNLSILIQAFSFKSPHGDAVFCQFANQMTGFSLVKAHNSFDGLHQLIEIC